MEIVYFNFRTAEQHQYICFEMRLEGTYRSHSESKCGRTGVTIDLQRQRNSFPSV